MTKYDDNFQTIHKARRADEPLPLRKVNLHRLEPQGTFARAKARVVSALIPTIVRVFKRISPVQRAFGFVWVTQRADVLALLEDRDAFRTPYGPEMADLTGTLTFALGDDGEIHKRQRMAMQAAWQGMDLQTVRDRARTVADALIEDAGGRIDVTRELFPYVTAHSAIEVLGLRVSDMPGFIDAALACNSLLFADPDGDPGFRVEARLGARVLQPIISEAVKRAMSDASESGTGLLERAAAWYGKENIEDALAHDDLTAIAYGLIIGYSPTASLFASGVVRTLSKRSNAFAKTRNAAILLRAQDKPAEASVRAFDAIVLELGRFHPALTPGQFRVRTNATLNKDPGGRLHGIREGETVIAATSTLVHDPDHVQNPGRFDPTRADDKGDPSLDPAYASMFGHDAHACLGKHLSIAIVAETLTSLMSREKIAFAQRFPRMKTIGPVPGTLEMVWEAHDVTATQSQITAAIPLNEGADTDTVCQTLQELRGAGNLAKALDQCNVVHFASFNVLQLGRRGKERPHLLVELNVDGNSEVALDRIWANAGSILEPAISRYIEENTKLRNLISRYMAQPSRWPWRDVGLNFVGTGEFSIAQIERERRLAEHLDDLLFAKETYRGIPLTEPNYADAQAGVPIESQQIVRARAEAIKAGYEDMLHRVRSRGPDFARDPLISYDGFLMRYAGQPLFVYIATGFFALTLIVLALVIASVWSVQTYLSVWLVPFLLLFTINVTLAIWVWRRERSDKPDQRSVSLERLRAIRDSEDKQGQAQSHITTVTTMKAGLLRRLTFAFSLYVVASFTKFWFRRGFLTDFATIHYARWLRLKGTDQMVFQSNFDGSWESYLEDFVTKVHGGQTLVWSNGEGFPATRWLFLDGARDGDRFKRWVRRQQVTTPFWYSRFPNLTMPQIHSNALIRDGLARARDVSEHRDWLKLFGSLPQRKGQIEGDQIQSLVFRGLGSHSDASCIPVRFDDPEKVRPWLGRIAALAANDRNVAGLSRPSYSLRVGDAKVHGDALFVAFSAGGLEKLKLGKETNSGLDTFSGAFLDGMEQRTQILGDESAKPRWIGTGASVPVDGTSVDDSAEKRAFDADAIVLIYSSEKNGGTETGTPQEQVFAELKANGMTCFEAVKMALPNKERSWRIKMEFREGASQPVMRGTDRAATGNVPEHCLLEPGEFVLGYPDSRGYVAPEVSVRADAAAIHTLPLVGKARDVPYPYFGDPVRGAFHDFGRNGSFLVVRQLQINHEKFDNFSQRSTVRLARRFYPLLEEGKDRNDWEGNTTHDWQIKQSIESFASYFPNSIDFVLAKSMGRWPDGSSLVRNPVMSATATRRLKIFEILKSRQHSEPYKKLLHDEKVDSPNPLVWHDSSWAILKSNALSMGIDFNTLVPPIDNLMDNDFLYGRDDPQGLACPFGSHIRRANPRDTPNPDNPDQIAINNRHRIIRRGRLYNRTNKESHEEGLMFMCLNADIERQFEFIQQTWLNSPNFQGLRRSPDPIAAAYGPKDRFIIPHEDSHTALSFADTDEDVEGATDVAQTTDQMQSFSELVGGGYFFLPSLAALRYLGRPDR